MTLSTVLARRNRFSNYSDAQKPEPNWFGLLLARDKFGNGRAWGIGVASATLDVGFWHRFPETLECESGVN